MSELASQGGLDEDEQRWFVVAAPALEEVVAAEVRRLAGARAVEVVEGGVELIGTMEVGMRANLWLRTATRVLLRVATVRAREFAVLRRLLAELPWERWVSAQDPLRVVASASRSRLYHTGALSEALVLAVGDRLTAHGRRPPALAAKIPPGRRRRGVGEGDADDDAGDEGQPDPDAASVGPETRVLLRGVSDRWTVSIDSSGELLHRRGWRAEGGRAPLRETLAAALLELAGHDPAAPLLDPMCGSGTIAIEAAGRAAGRAPGAGRAFAFQRWPGFDERPWRSLLQAASSPPSPVTAPGASISAWDRDPLAVARAQRNAERAGLAARIAVSVARFGAEGSGVSPPEALSALLAGTGGRPGLVVINPPYGRRLGHTAAASRLVKDIGRTLRTHFAGWSAAILLADGRWASALGLPVRSRLPLSSGGLRLTLAIVDVPVPGERGGQRSSS